MAEEPVEADKLVPSGLLGALNLSPKALLAVALVALLVWWYYDDQGTPLSGAETAFVVVVLALLFAGAGLVIGWLRRRAPTPDKTK